MHKRILLTSLVSLIALGAAGSSHAFADSYYRVKPGDTLSRISNQQHVSLQKIQQLNHISNANHLSIGQSLLLKKDVKTQAVKQPAQKPSLSTYRVVRGDSLSAIAMKHGMSLTSLLTSNHLTMRSIIHPGQLLKVSSVSQVKKPVVVTSTKTNQSGSQYVVARGDTLSGIATHHKMSLADLLNRNRLTVKSVIHPGQLLKVSSVSQVKAPSVKKSVVVKKPVVVTSTNTNQSGSQYVVVRGDTLSGIATRHKMSLADLLKRNQLTVKSVIHPGQKLIVNSLSYVNKSVNKPSNNAVPSSSTNATYRIARGDTLYQIAVKYKMSLSELLQKNNLTSNSIIYVGQSLSVQGQSQSSPVVSNASVVAIPVSDNSIHNTLDYTGLSQAQIGWLNQLSSEVKTAVAGTGVRASITVAQAILESGWGSSNLASAPYYNLFGIKTSSAWSGAQVYMKTREVIKGHSVIVNAPFRSYGSMSESVRDHTNFLLLNSRYAQNGVINSVSYRAMANGLQQAGYATDPNYANSLIRLVEHYHLDSLDENMLY